MRMKRPWNFASPFVAFGAAIAAGSIFGISGAAAQEAEGGQANAIQEVVVTAEKREENLQKVPVSVTAFTPQEIEVNRIDNPVDLASYAPNLYVVAQPGGNGIPQYTLRGVVAGNSEPQVDNPVSLYIDGVYIGRETGSVFDLADIERIEVLRGPQGTLFGRSTTGGAISVITASPTGQFYVRQDVSVGNYDLIRSKTRVDLPEWNHLSAQFIYLYQDQQGDINNLGGGQGWDFSNRTGGQTGYIGAVRTLGGGQSNALHAALDWKPISAFTLAYKYDWTYSPERPPATGAITDPDGLIALGGGKLSPLSRPDFINNWFTSYNDNSVTTHNVTAKWVANDWLTVKNIAAVHSYHNQSINQIDGAGGLTDPYGLFGGPAGSPLLLVAIASETQVIQKSDELQFNLDFKPVSVTAGLLYFKENIDGSNFGSSQEIVVSDAPNFVLPGAPTPASYQENKSKAAYAQTNFHLTGRLDLVLGARETQDNRSDIEPGLTPSASSQKHFTYLADLTYRPTDQITTYGKISTGYVSGGYVNGAEFQPETLRQVEVGAKMEFWDQRLRVNTAAYYSWYQDQQFPLFLLGYLQVLNAQEAHISGGELELTAIPVTGVTLTANFGFTDFNYDVVEPTIVKAVGGPPFLPTYIPRWTNSFSAQYEFPKLSWGGQLTARADTEYRDAYNTQATGVFPAPVTWLLNGRIALSHIPLGHSEGTLALWGKNLTNAKEYTFIDNLGVSLAANWEAARTYGLDLSVKF
jgi:iron complex outermembrane recepter protein